jgi:hypothetical protein
MKFALSFHLDLFRKKIITGHIVRRRDYGNRTLKTYCTEIRHQRNYENRCVSLSPGSVRPPASFLRDARKTSGACTRFYRINCDRRFMKCECAEAFVRRG